MANIQNYQCFVNSGSEPDQELTHLYTDYLGYWEPNEIDWGDLGPLDGDGIDLDWMGQPLEGTDMTRLSVMNTERNATPDASAETPLLLDNSKRGVSPQTNISYSSGQSDQGWRSSSSNSRPSSILFSASSSQSPPTEPETPAFQPSSSSLPPSTSHSCTICQPHRSFSSAQGLK